MSGTAQTRLLPSGRYDLGLILCEESIVYNCFSFEIESSLKVTLMMLNNFFKTLTLLVLLSWCNSPVAMATSDDVHPCDDVAAHIQDKQRWGKGISDEEVAPALAISRCAAAVKEYPETARFQFQLGRAFWIAQRYREAIAPLTAAATGGHAAAYAYLGEAYKNGLGGVLQDNNRAMKYYQLAAESGFKTAEDVLTTLQKEAKQSTFSSEGFQEPGIIQGLYTGDFALFPSGYDQWFLDVYLLTFSEWFNDDVKFADKNSDNVSSCVLLYDPELKQILANKVVADHPLYGRSGSSDPAQQGFGVIKEMFSQVLKAREPGGFQDMANKNKIDGGMALQTLKRKAAKDALYLANTYGCDGKIVKQIYRNIKPYASNTSSFAVVSNPRLTQDLTQGCQSYFQDSEKCTCLVNAILKSSVPEDEQELLAAGFTKKRLDRIQTKYARFNQNIRSCSLNLGVHVTDPQSSRSRK